MISLTHTLIAQSLPHNGGFEETESVSISGNEFEMPQNWNWSDFGAELTTDAASGNNAALIWNWYYYGKGYIQNGDPASSLSHGDPIDFRPSAMTGSYKYILGDVFSTNDSAVAFVYLTKFNLLNNTRDTIGRGIKKFPPLSEYESFQVDIVYENNELPDSVFVRFESSQNGFCSNSSDGNCLYFYVDDVTLTNETAGISNSIELFTASVFPNPGSDHIVLSNPGSQPMIAELVAADSRSIAFYSVDSNSSNVIDCSGFPSGVYFFRMDDGRSVIKWIKE
jgi:hypothetical protein